MPACALPPCCRSGLKSGTDAQPELPHACSCLFPVNAVIVHHRWSLLPLGNCLPCTDLSFAHLRLLCRRRRQLPAAAAMAARACFPPPPPMEGACQAA